MEVSAGRDGIQQLLAAEQDAQVIVTKARKAKADRLRQAKDEAEREIGAYKTEREAEFRRKIEEDSTTSAGNLQKLTEESAAQVKAIQQNIAKKKDQVLQLLMKDVERVYDN